MDFDVSIDYRVKLEEIDLLDKYLDFAREQKNWSKWRWKWYQY